MLEFAFTTVLDDYVAFAMHNHGKSKDIRLARRFVRIAVTLSAAMGAAVLRAKGENEFAVVAAAFAVAFWSLYPRCSRALAAHQIRSYANGLGTHGLIGPIRLSMGEHGLIEQTARTRTESPWKGMHGVEEVGDRTFIMVTAMSAAILPRHAFPDDAEYRRARDFAISHIGVETSSPPAHDDL